MFYIKHACILWSVTNNTVTNNNEIQNKVSSLHKIKFLNLGPSYRHSSLYIARADWYACGLRQK